MLDLLDSNFNIELESIYERFKYRIHEVNEYNHFVNIFNMISFLISEGEHIKLYDIQDNDFLNIEFDHWKKSYISGKYEKISCHQSIVTICSIYEEYILDILRILYKKFPMKLIAMDKKSRDSQIVTYKELLQYDSINDIANSLIEQKIRKIVYESIIKSINRIKIFYCDFCLDEDIQNLISDTYLMRHLIVHNKGLVSQEFIDKVVLDKDVYKLNELIVLDFKTIDDLIVLFEDSASYIKDFILQKAE